MADRVVYIGGNPVKLIDNGDDTFSIGASADVTVNADVSIGSIRAEHDTDGAVKLTAVKDGTTGKYYLAVADVAPHGLYEEGDDL